jgi:hypothetical protein
MHSRLLGTRRAISTAVDGFAGNMEVVGEESGPTDTPVVLGGFSRKGTQARVRRFYAQVPAPRLCSTAGGLASSNIPDTDRQGRRDSLGRWGIDGR